MIGMGTGRIINTSVIKMHPEYRAPSKAIFTNPALTLDAEQLVQNVTNRMTAKVFDRSFTLTTVCTAAFIRETDEDFQDDDDEFAQNNDDMLSNIEGYGCERYFQR